MKPKIFILAIFISFLVGGCTFGRGLFQSLSNSIPTTTEQIESPQPPIVKSTPTITLEPPLVVEKENFTATPSIIDQDFVFKWKSVDHIPNGNQIRALLIDSTGLLWAGGPGGLVRWDINTGREMSYVIWDSKNETQVVGLTETPDKAIWIATYGYGLTKIIGGDWKVFTKQDGLPGNFINGLAPGKDGFVWLDIYPVIHSDPTQLGYFGSFVGNRWISGEGGGFFRITAAQSGIVWAVPFRPVLRSGTWANVAQFNGKEWKIINIANEEKSTYVSDIVIAPDESIWVASKNYVYWFDGTNWNKIAPPWSNEKANFIVSMAIDSDNIAWFGLSFYGLDPSDICGEKVDYVEEKGVYRFDGQNWMHFTVEDGLVDNKVCDVVTDQSGTVWFGSFDNGISQYDGEKWKSYVLP